MRTISSYVLIPQQSVFHAQILLAAIVATLIERHEAVEFGVESKSAPSFNAEDEIAAVTALLVEILSEEDNKALATHLKETLGVTFEDGLIFDREAPVGECAELVLRMPRSLLHQMFEYFFLSEILGEEVMCIAILKRAVDVLLLWIEKSKTRKTAFLRFKKANPDIGI